MSEEFKFSLSFNMAVIAVVIAGSTRALYTDTVLLVTICVM